MDNAQFFAYWPIARSCALAFYNRYKTRCGGMKREEFEQMAAVGLLSALKLTGTDRVGGRVWYSLYDQMYKLRMWHRSEIKEVELTTELLAALPQMNCKFCFTPQYIDNIAEKQRLAWVMHEIGYLHPRAQLVIKEVFRGKQPKKIDPYYYTKTVTYLKERARINNYA